MTKQKKQSAEAASSPPRSGVRARDRNPGRRGRSRRASAGRRDLAKADIFEYVEMFYNRTRRHSHLGGVSPEAFEVASNLRL